MDKIADKIIAKYRQSSCEELSQKKAEKAPSSAEEKKMIQLLKGDPQMRQAFINKIATPIANKMFDSGLTNAAAKLTSLFRAAAIRCRRCLC